MFRMGSAGYNGATNRRERRTSNVSNPWTPKDAYKLTRRASVIRNWNDIAQGAVVIFHDLAEDVS